MPRAGANPESSAPHYCVEWLTVGTRLDRTLSWPSGRTTHANARCSNHLGGPYARTKKAMVIAAAQRIVNARMTGPGSTRPRRAPP